MGWGSRALDRAREETRKALDKVGLEIHSDLSFAALQTRAKDLQNELRERTKDEDDIATL